jgi:DNA-binding transcriptional regulator YdaS (Cro superfamily)
MKLRTYLESTNTTLTALAERLGVGVSTVHGWVSGRRVPTLEMALRIRDITDGAVTPDDLRPPPPDYPGSSQGLSSSASQSDGCSGGSTGNGEGPGDPGFRHVRRLNRSAHISKIVRVSVPGDVA